MKLIVKQCLICLFAAIMATLTSCSNNDDDLKKDIEGTWIGIHQYHNPVSGYKYIYLYMTFHSDGTGELEYDHPTSYSYGYFTYSVSGDKISCKGAKASTSGDLDSDFKMTLNIQGDRLITNDKFKGFILTSDGSVKTDLEGNEIIDQSGLLLGVWVNKNNKSTILEFTDNETLVEYVLDPPGSTNYSSKKTMHYSYDDYAKTVIIDGAKYKIDVLNESYLSLSNTSSKNYFSYTRGSESDIPDAINLKAALLKGFSWSSNYNKIFTFTDPNKVFYIESKSSCDLDARGTFELNGNTLVCDYDDVSWDNSYLYPDLFPGWKPDQPTRKTYHIEIVKGYLYVTDSSGSETRYKPLYTIEN